MPEGKSPLHFKAVRMLVFATVLWGISFPITRAIAMLEGEIVPGVSTWFYTALGATTRFLGATIVTLLIGMKTFRAMTRLEIWQGLGLGFFGGIGILFQMDGLAHTSASISAFLTQTYCICVPIIVAVRDKKSPGSRIIISTILMMIGVAILDKISPRNFHLGRGEVETIIAAVIFSGQILWLERPIFKGNDVLHMSLVMFATMALISAPVLLVTTGSARNIALCFSNGGVLVLTATLTLLCTVIAYIAMNKWQPYVPAAEASIIYGVEPVLASAFALFVPSIISRYTGIDYPNERLTPNLLTGGLIIVGANLLIQLGWVKKKT
jgi:drug/metabolite transporter (DMT)-like permease